MSYRKRPRTCKGRIDTAIRLLKSNKINTRLFDYCFEMFDGDQVVRGIMEVAYRDAGLRHSIELNGFWDNWSKFYNDRPGQIQLFT